MLVVLYICAYAYVDAYMSQASVDFFVLIFLLFYVVSILISLVRTRLYVLQGV